MAQFYDVPVRFSPGQNAVGRGLGNNATWVCACGELLLGPHEGVFSGSYEVPPCPKCRRTYSVIRGTAPQYVDRVEERQAMTKATLKELAPGTSGANDRDIEVPESEVDAAFADDAGTFTATLKSALPPVKYSFIEVLGRTYAVTGIGPTKNGSVKITFSGRADESSAGFQ